MDCPPLRICFTETLVNPLPLRRLAHPTSLNGAAATPLGISMGVEKKSGLNLGVKKEELTSAGLLAPAKMDVVAPPKAVERHPHSRSATPSTPGKRGASVSIRFRAL